MSLCLHPGSSYVFFLVVLAYCCELRTTHAFLHESLRQANAIMASFEYSAEVLIDAIKMYPYLYDKRHPSFKDRTKKDRAWAEIGSMFGMSTATSQQTRLTRVHRLGQAMQRNRNVPLIRLRRLMSTPAAMMMLQQPPQESSQHQNGHAHQDDNGPARALAVQERAQALKLWRKRAWSTLNTSERTGGLSKQRTLVSSLYVPMYASGSYQCTLRKM
ncbi:uncharacterized protein LOC142786386 isoform X4 [Rhipicephalus microplus]|uniref:uncharacterized protein LOC142786386 isoform X4 n=1 Tax=Rhipicephalus microplus TaxID=6941 RepID=UPI003F6ADF1F